MGFGGCTRDSSGNWSLDGGDVLTSELKAISTWLNLLLIDDSQERSKIIIETDSSTAINLIKYNYSNHHPMRKILQLCRHLLTKLQDYTFVKDSRDQNKCADKLAKDGRVKCLPLIVYDTVPDIVLQIYNEDKPPLTPWLFICTLALFFCSLLLFVTQLNPLPIIMPLLIFIAMRMLYLILNLLSPWLFHSVLWMLLLMLVPPHLL